MHIQSRLLVLFIIIVIFNLFTVFSSCCTSSSRSSKFVIIALRSFTSAGTSRSLLDFFPSQTADTAALLTGSGHADAMPVFPRISSISEESSSLPITTFNCLRTKNVIPDDRMVRQVSLLQSTYTQWKKAGDGISGRSWSLCWSPRPADTQLWDKFRALFWQWSPEGLLLADGGLDAMKSWATSSHRLYTPPRMVAHEY